jgi:hypothetical protein
MEINRIYRYKQKITLSQDEDGFPNWYHETNLQHHASIMLSRGINVPSFGENQNIPVILLRTSAWRSGTSDVPWSDIKVKDTNSLIYFGDGKLRPSRKDINIGNKYMMKAFGLHSGSINDRKKAPPIIYMESIPWKGSQKGYVKLVGIGVISKAEVILQKDPISKDIFQNICFEINFIDLSHDNRVLDWKWINARRTEIGDDNGSSFLAPKGWTDWVENGMVAISTIKNKVVDHTSSENI